MLSAGAFSDEQVIEASKQVVCVYIDLEWGRKHMDLGEHYRVQAFPTVIYTDHEGAEIGRMSTFDAGVIAGKAVLSRDGSRMAGVESAGDGKLAAVVADTATGKEIRRVPVKARPFEFRFAGRDRLAELFCITAAENERGVRFVDFAAGAEGALLPGKVTYVRAVSPGGRYFAVATKEKVFVIAAADEHGLAMVFTGYRHFRH